MLAASSRPAKYQNKLINRKLKLAIAYWSHPSACAIAGRYIGVAWQKKTRHLLCTMALISATHDIEKWTKACGTARQRRGNYICAARDCLGIRRREMAPINIGGVPRGSCRSGDNIILSANREIKTRSLRESKINRLRLKRRMSR